LRGPLTNMTVSSGFGMRVDPFGEPTGKSLGMGGPQETQTAVQSSAARSEAAIDKAADAEPAKEEPKKEPTKRRRSTIAFSGLGGFAGGSGSSSGADFANGRRAIGRETFIEPTPAPEVAIPKEEPKAEPKPAARPSVLFMHSGVDLVAPTGTPIFAAADGVVMGAHPKGPYGNWIRIDHPGRVTTIYGHLSKYAPEVFPGATVTEGQLIGYVGSTGRSTGAHLHFEVWRNGVAVDPLKSAEMKPPILNWTDQQRLKAQVARATAQRGQEVADLVLDQ
jgi:murein DD-endopeptidase MepM/ murein hydrolase activator NlpD